MPRIARVIDYETTGLPEDPNAEILEFGRIDVDLTARRVLTETAWSSLCRPRGPISPGTKAIHHILEEDVRDAPEARELWEPFYDGCSDGDYLCAHNAKFEQHFHEGDGRQWIDTYKVARVVWPDAPTHSNQGLRYWLGLPCDRRLSDPPHRAGPDAYVTAHLLVRLLDEKAPEEMAVISRYPALIKTMNFGKHRGMAFADAPLDYLQWIVDKSEMDEDTKFSAKYWIQKRTRHELHSEACAR